MNVRSKSNIKDMTVGSPAKLLVLYALPTMIGLFFQQLYNTVDTLIIGRLIGVSALAGVGSTGSISFLILGFCHGIGTGLAIPIAQSFGAKQEERLRRDVANILWLSIGICAVVTVLASVFCRQILTVMQTPPEDFEYAYRYIFVIFLGIPFSYAYNLLAGLLRALGNTKTPLYFLILSAFLNVALDLLAVGAFGMGVEGVALATVVSNGISALCCLIVIIRKYEILHVRRGEWRPDFKRMRYLFGIGAPMGLQFSITAIGSVILQRAVNVLGEAAVAAQSTGSRLQNIFVVPLDALATTLAMYAGQNIGARDLGRVDRGLRAMIGLGWAYSAAACLVLVFCGKPLSSLFVDTAESASAEIIGMAGRMSACIGVAFFFLTLIFAFRLTIQGMGYSAISLGAGISEMIARLVIGVCFVPLYGFDAVALASPIAWVLGDLFLVPAYFVCRHLVKKRFAAQALISADVPYGGE